MSRALPEPGLTHRRLLAAGLGTALAAMLLPVVGAAGPAQAAGGKAKAWDFNGDGHRELAIGAPGEDAYTGSVTILRGTANGLTSKGARRISQDTPGIPGVNEAGDRFGTAVASGDFNGDGYADLAIGTPSEDGDAKTHVGAVTVVYGSAHGLKTSTARFLHRPDVVLGDPDPQEAHFGFRLLSADFDGNGKDDLVVSVDTNRGGVLIYQGHKRGLASLPAQQLGPHFGLPDDAGFAFPGDLAAGDLDGNGVADLVVGWPEHDAARGAVVVEYGARGHGIDKTGSRVRAPQVWTENSPGVIGTAKPQDVFGMAVAVGDVDGDGHKDLVATSLKQPNGTAGVTGAIHVLRGTRYGVTSAGDQYLLHDKLIANPIGAMGEDLAVGYLDDDGIADVAVTASSYADGWWGRVIVAYGNSKGVIGAARTRVFSQASPGVGGVTGTKFDYWGSKLAIRDVGKSRQSDLIASDPFEFVSGVSAGMVNVAFGASTGVHGRHSQTFTEETPGIPGAAEDADAFGNVF